MRDQPDDSYAEPERATNADHATAPKRGLTRRRVLLGTAGAVAGLGDLGAGVSYVTDRAGRFGRGEALGLQPRPLAELPAGRLQRRGVHPHPRRGE